jgi:hypothetical protein
MTDYAAQAAAHVADGELTELDVEGWTDPDTGKPWKGWSVYVPELNASVDLGGFDEDHARAKAADFFADVLRTRDPDYVAPQTPSAADTVLAALDSLDTTTATVEDVITAVKGSLLDAGATPAA